MPLILKINDKEFNELEIEYFVSKYLEIQEIAQIFQPGGKHHEAAINIMWGQNIVVEGFKFLLAEYENKIK